MAENENEAGLSHPFVVNKVPGKGLGLVVTKPIPKGTQIMVEAPFLWLPHRADTSYLKVLYESLYALSEADRAQFYSFQNVYGDRDESNSVGIAKTNVLYEDYWNKPTDGGGMYLYISRINHSCRENTQLSFKKDGKSLAARANRDIKEGEEITIAYLPVQESRQKRREMMLARLRFWCCCDYCNLPEEEQRRSNQVLWRVSKSLLAARCMADDRPLEALHALQQAENGLISEKHETMALLLVYLSIFKLLACHGDEVRAGIFALRALDLAKTLYGPGGLKRTFGDSAP